MCTTLTCLQGRAGQGRAGAYQAGGVCAYACTDAAGLHTEAAVRDHCIMRHSAAALLMKWTEWGQAWHVGVTLLAGTVMSCSPCCTLRQVDGQGLAPTSSDTSPACLRSWQGNCGVTSNRLALVQYMQSTAHSYNYALPSDHENPGTHPERLITAPATRSCNQHNTARDQHAIAKHRSTPRHVSGGHLSRCSSAHNLRRTKHGHSTPQQLHIWQAARDCACSSVVVSLLA
jgi:hypothetical protein